MRPPRRRVRRSLVLTAVSLSVLTTTACGAGPLEALAARESTGTVATIVDTALAEDGAARSVTPAVAPAAGAVARTVAARTGGDNIFVGRPWGVFKGNAEHAWAPYLAATGDTKVALGKIALTPKAKWFGSWIATSDITRKVREYVDNSQRDNPDALVQATIFRVKPWEHEACTRLPSTDEKDSYRAWIRNFAAGLGNAPTAIVMQPDGPFALCAPGGSRVYSKLVRYAVRTLEALPRTDVYIEAGASDWPHAGAQGGAKQALKILLRGGIRRAKGVALNGTHYGDPIDEVRRGAKLVRLLEERGIPGKKVVINTANSGNPFEFGDYSGRGLADNAFVCKSTSDDRTCVTLGIPPTPDVANPRWGLPLKTRELAAEYVDAFLWFGRPWLYMQADPFLVKRAVKLVNSSPFQDLLPYVADGSQG